MLYSLDTDSYISQVPHRRQYEIWRSRLSDGELEAIKNELSSRLSDSEVETSSWIPGEDWRDTVFQPIYDKAARGDFESAAKCFGLILWEVVMEDENVWSFGRYELDGLPIQGLTYFRLGHPPLL